MKFNTVYALPFGPHNHWMQKGPLSYVIGGWQISSILTLKSGSPYTYTDTVNRTLAGMSFQEQRPMPSPDLLLAAPSAARRTKVKMESLAPSITIRTASCFRARCSLETLVG